MNETLERKELFAALQELSAKTPAMRAGQLMAAVGELSEDIHGRGLWDAADSELLEAIWRFQQNFEAAVPTESKT